MAACSGGQSAASPALVDDVLADGTVTDGELEHSWRLAEECLRDAGIDGSAVLQDGRWGIVISGDYDEDAYFSCTEAADVVSNQYQVERIPEGAERVELAKSLAECLGKVGITDVPYDPGSPDESAVVASAIEQLGYKSGEQDLLEDPRFATVLDCIDSHALLFPDRFAAAAGD